MLRQTLALLTTQVTGVSLSTAHTIGLVPDICVITGRNQNGSNVYLLAVDAANVHVANSVNSLACVDVTLWNWQGRLY